MSGTPWNLVESTLFFQSLLSDETGNNLVGLYNNYLIFKSSDYGTTWTSGVDVNTNNYINNIASNSTLQNIVVVGSNGAGPDYIYRSIDYGVTFSPLINSPLALWQTITSDSTGQYLVAAQADNAYKKIFYSNDFGDSWSQSIVEDENFWYNLISSYDGQYVIISG